MGVKKHHALALYRASPEVTPSARIDAFVLAAARASHVPSRRREWILAGAAVAAAAAMFFVRVATTPTQNLANDGFGLDEGVTRAWLLKLDLQQPTGPGSQEGLP